MCQKPANFSSKTPKEKLKCWHFRKLCVARWKALAGVLWVCVTCSGSSSTTAQQNKYPQKKKPSECGAQLLIAPRIKTLIWLITYGRRRRHTMPFPQSFPFLTRIHNKDVKLDHTRTLLHRCRVCIEMSSTHM